jgi:hypothetical protein
VVPAVARELQRIRLLHIRSLLRTVFLNELQPSLWSTLDNANGRDMLTASDEKPPQYPESAAGGWNSTKTIIGPGATIAR